MNPARLALLINDTFDAVERSKVGPIYLKRDDGSIVTTTEGCPYANQAAVQILQTSLQSLIYKASLEAHD